jgi:hypothetical protein
VWLRAFMALLEKRGIRASRSQTTPAIGKVDVSAA